MKMRVWERDCSGSADKRRGGSAPCGSYSPTGGLLVVGATGTDSEDAGVGAPIARTQLIKERTAQDKSLVF